MKKIKREDLVKMVVFVLISAGVLVAGYGVKTSLDSYIKLQGKRYVSEAVDGCLAASKVERSTDSDGQSIVAYEPIDEVYVKCMEDKGL